MYKRSENDTSKEIPHLNRLLLAVILAGLAVSACNASERTEHDVKSNPTSITAEGLSSAKYVKSAVKSGKAITFYRGDLILATSEGESIVVVNPIIKPKRGATTQSSNNIVNNYNFYYLVANINKDGNLTLQSSEVNLSSFNFELRPSVSGCAINSSVIEESGKELINTPALYSPIPNSSIAGFNSASFDYHTAGNSYYVSSYNNQTPVGVMLEGQAVDDQ